MCATVHSPKIRMPDWACHKKYGEGGGFGQGREQITHQKVSPGPGKIFGYVHLTLPLQIHF
jgi:hypothetical protein